MKTQINIKTLKTKHTKKKKKREVDAVKDKNICYTLKSSKTKYTIIMRRLSKTLVIAK
jgi:hypothetical protein